MSRMREARDIGLRTCERISKKGLKFIEKNDPDLHYDIMQELNKRRKSK